MVEHLTENQGVVGSIPILATAKNDCREYIALGAVNASSNLAPHTNQRPCGDRLVVRTTYVSLSNTCLREFL